jgi:hypothetical protein
MRIYNTLPLLALFFATDVFADNNAQNIEISIYNSNLALVKDVRSISLSQGINDIAFEGVATEIKPESVMIVGKDINVLEQNYDYDLITEHNIIKKSVGKEVKTIVQNPTTGENIFNKAKILSASGNKPILEFDYGIETDFNGRLVFDELPKNLREKPTLMAKLYSPDLKEQDLMLAYLTNGISWKTDYVAYIKNETTLDLTAWVTINNNSGVDYNGAKIQLVAGDVNQVTESFTRGPMLMAAKVYDYDSVSDSMAANNVTPEQLSSYQLYTLPNRTDIKNSQTKQMSLFEKFDVKYTQEGRLTSPLYFNGTYKADFEKRHPQMYYIMNNTSEGGLDISLPGGKMRFYENDAQNSLQFIGENNINNTAKGETIELMVGNMFNVFVNGKVVDVTEVSKTKKQLTSNSCYNADVVKDYVANVEFNNGDDKKVTVSFVQNINSNEVIKESIKGNNKNINQHEWKIEIPGNDKVKLDYVVRVKSNERICD